MAETNSHPRAPGALTTGLALIAVGIACITTSGLFDGFVKGMFQGGGIMLTLIGVYLISRAKAWGKGEDGPSDDWLPSRDGDR